MNAECLLHVERALHFLISISSQDWEEYVDIGFPQNKCSVTKSCADQDAETPKFQCSRMRDIKRPWMPYTLFLKESEKSFFRENPNVHYNEFQRIVARKWNEMSSDDKKVF